MAERVKITCLCGKVQERVSLDTTMPVVVCHCNICRWTAGTLFYSAFALLEPPDWHYGLTRYDSSPKVSRYFCDTCGTHICHQIHRNNGWNVPTGVVDQVIENEQVSSCRKQQIAEHQFVANTGDGGLAVCLAGSSQRPAYFYMHGNNVRAVDILSEGLFTQTKNTFPAETGLRAACHCGGVEFFLSRPSEKSRECSSPWPDLLRPYNSYNPANPEDVKWWLVGPDKYLAGTCACRTCRLSNSSPITSWAFIPKVNLHDKDGSPIDFDLGTLQSYQSSKGKTRSFCRACGASVFLRIDERPDLIDVSLGLFRASEGARAENWFKWCTDRVSFAEEALDKDLVATCEWGLKTINRSARPAAT